MKMINIELYEKMLKGGFRQIGEGQAIKRDDGTVLTPVRLRRNGWRDQDLLVVLPPPEAEPEPVPAEVVEAVQEVIATNPAQ